MRPEHSETKTKTETRECETKIETETETKNLLRDRDQKLRDRDRDQSSQVIACESNTSRYVLFFYYTHEVNDKPQMDFTFKMIGK